MRIDQVIPTIVPRDAVSAHTFEAQRVLRDMGADSDIFAINIHASLHDRVRPLWELDARGSKGSWLVYQASIGSQAADVFAIHPSRKLVNYHNLTPADLVESFERHLAAELRLGQSQIHRLAPLSSLGIATSAYNAAELVEAGYRSTAIVPPLIDLAPRAEPDIAVRRRLSDERAGGGSCWLYVGQVLPHKGQHALVEALAYYRVAYDSRAHLHLVGREASRDYGQAVRRLAHAIGLEDAVHFEGSVTDGELIAFYAGADVFVCCSRHEGFCAPIVEAMHHRLPIVAFAAAAVPETLGSAGIKLPARTPSLVAAAVDRVLCDGDLRHRLADLAGKRARDFGLELSRVSYAEAVEAAVRSA